MATRLSERKSVQSTELDIVYGSFCKLCALVASLVGVTYLRYTVLTRPKKAETAVHCCDSTLSVLVVLVSRTFFHVVLALQSIAFIHI